MLGFCYVCLVFAIYECQAKVEWHSKLDLVICLLVTQTEMILMRNQENQIQIVETNWIYPDLHQMKHFDSTHSIETILVVFTLLNGLNKLWVSIDKMRKQRKINPDLLLQTVGAIGVILKAINDLLNRDDDNNDD